MTATGLKKREKEGAPLREDFEREGRKEEMHRVPELGTLSPLQLLQPVPCKGKEDGVHRKNSSAADPVVLFHHRISGILEGQDVIHV